MEQIKEMWDLVFNWIGNGKKAIMGGCFWLAGMIGQSMSDKTLTQIPFILMAMGLLCYVNALFSKVTKNNINLLIYLLLNIFLTEICIAVVSAGAVSETTMFGICIACVLVLWVLQVFMVRAEVMTKRIVLAFLMTCLDAVAVLAAFALPIIIEVWRENS